MRQAHGSSLTNNCSDLIWNTPMIASRKSLVNLVTNHLERTNTGKTRVTPQTGDCSKLARLSGPTADRDAEHCQVNAFMLISCRASAPILGIERLCPSDGITSARSAVLAPGRATCRGQWTVFANINDTFILLHLPFSAH